MAEVRVGSGFDVHAFAAGTQRPLVLGGVRIPGGPGLAGHSDADVVCHAATDALLGAVGAGDLGARFGTDRPEHAGAASTGLLRAVADELVDAGWRLVNLDLTVVAQRPRLAPHRDAMRERLAQVLEAESARVSVKFSTTDRLGAVGRGEGIACWAVCLVARR